MAKRRKHSSRQNPGPDLATPANNPFGALEDLRGRLPEGPQAAPEPSAADATGLSGKIVLQRERSGRGGKTVTVIRGIELEAPALEDLAQRLRRTLGTSGQVEAGAIVLGGDQCSRAADYLRQAGARRLIIGN